MLHYFQYFINMMNSASRKLLIISFCFIISLALFLRGVGGIDPDYDTYKYIYNMIDWGYESDLRVNDYAYILINKVAITLGVEFPVLLWIVGFLCLLIKSFAVSAINKNIIFVFLFFYCVTSFLIFEMIQIRIALALAFYYIFLVYYNSSHLTRFIAFLLFSLISSQLHMSSLLLFFATYVLSYFKKISIYPALILLSFTSSGVIGFLFDYVKVSNNQVLIDYFYQLTVGVGFNIESFLNPTLVLTVAFILLATFLSRRFNLDGLEAQLVSLSLNLLILSVVLFSILTVAPVIAYRISELFRGLVPITSAILFVKSNEDEHGIFFQIIILFLNLLYTYTYIKALSGI